MIDDLVKGVTPATNDDNLSSVGRRPVSATEEPVVLIPRSEMEAMLGKEKEKASVSLIYLDLKPSYDAEVTAKP